MSMSRTSRSLDRPAPLVLLYEAGTEKAACFSQLPIPDFMIDDFTINDFTIDD